MKDKLEVTAYIENNYPNYEKDRAALKPELDNIPWSNWFDVWLFALQNDLPPAIGY